MTETDRKKEGPAIQGPRKRMLLTGSVLMLLAALPMVVWCLNLIGPASLDYDYAGAGCFGAALAYVFSMVTAIAGISFAGKPYRYRWCRTLGMIQLTAGVLLLAPLMAYGFLTLPPLFILTVWYLTATGWREKRTSAQKGEMPDGEKEE